MKILTANMLSDGRVAYLGADNRWVQSLAEALVFSEEFALVELEKAATRTREVADIYLIDATEDAKPGGRTALRENIRGAGPTIRRDLGKQAGNH